MAEVTDQQYEVFDLVIDRPQGGEHPVSVTESPAGPAFASMRLPASGDELQRRLVDVERAVMTPRFDVEGLNSPAALPARQFGSDLYDAVFPDLVRRRLVGSQATAAERRKGLRIRLRIRAAELNALPWECLFDPQESEYLGLRNGTSIVRFVERGTDPRTLRVEGPVRVLGVVVEIPGDDRVDARREQSLVDEALADLTRRGAIELTWLENPTWQQLSERFDGEEWHVFHFAGHGGAGYLQMTLDGEIPADIPAADLALLLGAHPSLRLVFLNGCEGARGDGANPLSSTAETLVGTDIPAVVAMQYQVMDEAAISFARAFYDNLARRRPVDEAMMRARLAMLGDEFTLQWLVPVLYMRAPDGMLFAPAAAREEVEALAARGRALLGAGDPAGARDVFDDLVRLEAHEPAWRAWRSLAEAELAPGEAARKDVVAALTALESVASGAPQDAAIDPALRGLCLAATGRCDEAVAALDSAIGAGAAGGAEFVARARCHESLGNTARAVADYAQVLTLAPDHPAARYERGLLLAATGNHDGALDDLSEAVRLAPGNTAYRRARAASFEATREYALAAEDLSHAVEADPDRTELWLARARLRYATAFHEGRTEDYALAIADFDEAVRRAPGAPHTWFLRGRAWYQVAEEQDSADDAARAAADFGEATRQAPDEGEYHYYLGLALRRQGKREEAETALQRAAELGEERARGELGTWTRLRRWFGRG